MANLISYLASLVNSNREVERKLGKHDRRLDQILANTETIMATGQDLKNRINELVAGLAKIAEAQLAQAAAQEAQARALTNVASDIQALKDRIGTGEPGIPAEEATEVDGLLGNLVTTVTSAADAATQGAAASTQIAQNLQALADSTPDAEAPPTEEPPPDSFARRR
jgi:DNA repair exonuclease SbcCD ATPase subunit